MTTTLRLDLPCVILAGGKSRRFGSDKALAKVGGRSLIDVMNERLQIQTSGPIAINTGSPELQELYGNSVIPDRLSGAFGPLSGLHTAMCWAREHRFDSVVTTSVDTPLLPFNFIARLVEHGAPAIARSESGLQPLHGVWPTRLHEALESRLLDGMRAVRAWAELCHAAEIVFPLQDGVDPFFNVNTPADLDRLNELNQQKPG